MEVGTHCSLSSCNTLDFLPLPCDHCRLLFCRDHFLASSHSCPEAPEPPVPRSDGAPPQRYPCSVKGCSKAELAPVNCPACEVMVCLGHRHQSEHACTLLKEVSKPMQATREVVKGILTSVPEQPIKIRKPRSVKAQKTAAKVQLMKLKMKSKGESGLPQDERVYLLVTLPKTLQKQPQGAWVSKKWSMGRVVDSLAGHLGVDNRNNVAGADKLLIFRIGDGVSLCGDMSEPLESLLQREEMFNGDSVVLEYVAEGVDRLELSDS